MTVRATLRSSPTGPTSSRGWVGASAPGVSSGPAGASAVPSSTRCRTATRSSARTRCTRSGTCTSSGPRRSSSPEIAVGVREFASLNPNAIYRDPITVDDVVNSRMVADPLHKLDCCAITDGGGAFIMTTAERAKDLRNPPVYVLGAAGAQTHWNVSQQTDFTSSAGALAGPIAFEQAGPHARRRRHADVLRLVHDHVPDPAREPRVRAEGRRRPLRRGREPQARWQMAAEHRRWRAVVLPPRHARHLPHHRSGPTAARPGRREPRSPTATSRSRPAPAAGSAVSVSPSSGRTHPHDPTIQWAHDDARGEDGGGVVQAAPQARLRER